MNWTELRKRLGEYNANNFSSGIIGRDAPTEVRYKAFKKTGGSKKFIDSLFSENEVEITLNDYPYAVNQKIVHLLVWTKHREHKHDVMARLSLSPRILFFENPPSWKSIPSVFHLHVFVQKPRGVTDRKVLSIMKRFLRLR